MESVRARAAVHPTIPLAIVVFITSPRFKAAAPRGIGNKESRAAVSLMPPSEMPFAEVRRVIPVRIEHFGDRFLTLRQRVLVSWHAMMRVAAGEHRSAKRATQRESRKVI